MYLRRYVVAMLATAALLVVSGSAMAAFPNFSGCPTAIANFEGCINVQNTSGNLNIKGFNVPLGASLEIRGAIQGGEAGPIFVPPARTNGFFGTPVPVPGGLLGIEWIPGTTVLAITELAGPPSGITFDFGTFGLSVPVKVRLVNLLLGMDCHIGTDSSPVRLNLITGTTSPPGPNRPISGRIGTLEAVTNEIRVRDNVNVENSFAVPGASRCGLGLGLINTLVNAKLRLPSAGGNNSIEVTNNIGIRIP